MSVPGYTTGLDLASRKGPRRIGLRGLLMAGAVVVAAGALGLPQQARAQDTACLNPDGSVMTTPPPTTDEGQENAGGDNTTCTAVNSAFGTNNNASGDRANAFGRRNQALGEFSNAFGYSTIAAGEMSSAFGFFARTGVAAKGAIAVGGWYDVNGDGVVDTNLEIASATGVASAAFGTAAIASGDLSFAAGVASSALGSTSVAMGVGNRAEAATAIAIGLSNTASVAGAQAMGGFNMATGLSSNAFGRSNTASALLSGAFGVENNSSGTYASAFGARSEARGNYSSAFGFGAVTGINALRSLAIGGWVDLNGDGLRVQGEVATANGAESVAVGNGVTANADRSAAFGVNASTTALGSTAIGYGAVGDREYALSVGAAGAERNIIHVANAVEAMDAVNFSQLMSKTNFVGGILAQVMGGGATYNGDFTSQSFLFPNLTIQGVQYSNVAAAFGAVDARLTSLAAGTPGPTGPAGPQGPQGPQGPVGPGNPLAPAYDDASRDTLTLEGANGTRVSNLADGVAPTDAVNRRQMDAGDEVVRTYADAGDAATLASARTYADAGDAATLIASMAYTDQAVAAIDTRIGALGESVDRRFGEQGQRIDRLGAMSSAQLNMAMNAAGALPGRGRVAVGLGFQNGEEALSVGYGRRLGNGVSVSVGGAFGRHGEQSGGVGIGFDIF